MRSSIATLSPRAFRSCCVSQDVQEISPFSCMLFLSVHGFLDYTGPNQPLACNVVVVLPFSSRNGVGILFQRLFEAQSPRPLIPLSTLQTTPRDAARKTQGQNGFATLLFRRALSSPSRVEDWRGAFRFRRSVAPRFLMGVPQERHRGPAPIPASSNPACGFPALGFPVCFLPRLCG